MKSRDPVEWVIAVIAALVFVIFCQFHVGIDVTLARRAFPQVDSR